ncbi:MAG: autotransporter outer membrane beta-barrel domain-containing protein [Thermoguttaceae bacterium]
MKKWTFSSALIVFFTLPVLLYGVTEYHIGRGQPGDYATLNALRLAIAEGTISFADGDILTLYKDDNSLINTNTGPFYIPSDVGITIRSKDDAFRIIQGGSVWSAGYIRQFFVLEEATSSITLDSGLAMTIFKAQPDIYAGKGGIGIVGTGSAQFQDTMLINGYAVSGGALYIDGGTATVTDSSVTANNATQEGGAIDLGGGGTLNLKATSGRTTFFGDNVIRDVENEKIAHVSINFFGDATLNVQTESGGVVDIQNEKMTVSNDEAHIGIIKTGAGIWRQGGTSEFTNALGATHIDIREGTLELVNSVMDIYNTRTHNYDWVNTYGSFDISKGDFTLGGSATLLSTARNYISADEIIFDSGSTLAFNLTDAIREDAADPQRALTLTGTVIKPGSGTISVDLWNQLPNNGVYQLLDVGTDNIIANTDFTYKLFGNKISDLLMNERASEVHYSISADQQYLNVEIGADLNNYEMTWLGGTGGRNNTWSMTAGNWTENSSGKDYQYFFGGDAVVFDRSAGGTVQIAHEGVQIGSVDENFGIMIKSGSWDFTGGDIRGGGISLAGESASDAVIRFDTRNISQILIVLEGKAGTLDTTSSQELSLSNFYAIEGESSAFPHIVLFKDSELVLSGQGMTLINNNVNQGGDGGAIWINDGATLVLRSGMNQFSGNTADYLGGVIFGNNAASVQIEDGVNNFSVNRSGGGGAIAAQTVSITQGHNSFQGNRAFDLYGTDAVFGGAIQSEMFRLSGGINLFDSNSSIGDGGAVYASEIVISAGDNKFQNNLATYIAFSETVMGFGGALASDTLTITGEARNGFSGNTGTVGGAVFVYDTIAISGGNNTFDRNVAQSVNNVENSGYGGAIASLGATSISAGTNSFTENSALVGGAIAATGTLTMSGGVNTFTGNYAAETGGAISTTVVSITGGSADFIGNGAGTLGGAIYVANNLQLIANGGNITFRDNFQMVGSTSESTNAIFAANASLIMIAAKEGQNVSFFDPVETASNQTSTPKLYLNFNPTNNAEQYQGTILFDQYQSFVVADTILGEGTLQLTGGAIYGVGTDKGSFVAAYGSTLGFEIDGTDSSQIQVSEFEVTTNPFAPSSKVVKLSVSASDQGVVVGDDFGGFALIQTETEGAFKDLNNYTLLGARGGKLKLDGTNFMLGHLSDDEANKSLALVLYEMNYFYKNLGQTANQQSMGYALDWINFDYDPVENPNRLIERLLDMAEYNRGENMRLMTGEMKPNSFRLALSDPWTSAMDHVSFTRAAEGQKMLQSSENQYMGQSQRCGDDFWASGIFANENFFGDGNSDGFSLYRNGVAFGRDTKWSARTRRGFSFAYTDSSANQFGSGVQANDFQLGFYELRKLRRVWEGRGYLGMGLQGYQARRSVMGTDGFGEPTGLETIKGSYSGLSLAAKYELARLIYLSSSWTLLPLMSMDYQGAWQSGFTETGSTAALSYEAENFGLFRLGVGMDVRFFGGYNLSTTVRLRYFEHLGGDTPTSSSRFAVAGDAFQVNGTAIGRSYGQYGLGMKYDLCENNRWYLFGNYDLQTSHRSTLHYGTVGVGAKW